MTSATVAFGSSTRPPVTGIMTPRISRLVVSSAIVLSSTLAVVGGHFLGELLRRADETDDARLAHAIDHRADDAGVRVLRPDHAAAALQVLAALDRIVRHAGEDDRAGAAAELIGDVAQHHVDRRRIRWLLRQVRER